MDWTANNNHLLFLQIGVTALHVPYSWHSATVDPSSLYPSPHANRAVLPASYNLPPCSGGNTSFTWPLTGGVGSEHGADENYKQVKICITIFYFKSVTKYILYCILWLLI